MSKKLLLSLGSIFFIVLLAFRLIFLGRVPIPLDALVGLYHPYRDMLVNEYPRGLPYKNPLITDPVLQQIPWRNLAIDELKKFQLPLWNPYAFSGYPLLGNVQSAPFYPLNVVFLLQPFMEGWVLLIILQFLFGGGFMYLYLREKTNTYSSPIFGAVAFAFSGFFLSWMEWGTVAQTGMWLPLLLLCVDQLMNEKKKVWQLLFIVALFCSLSAGHLQTFVYVFVVTVFYFLYRLHQNAWKGMFPMIISLAIFGIISSILWIPQLQFILLSGRDADLSWQKDGFFIPLQHLIQFIVPDFFGNPATGNYFGVWNYGEFLGYVGISTIMLASITLVKRGRENLFFLVLLGISLLLSVDTVIAHIPYLLHLPFVSSTQPTRLLFITDFCLANLAAKGLDELLSEKKRTMLPFGILGILLASIIMLIPFHQLVNINDLNWMVTRRNLVLPIALGLSFGIVYGVSLLSPFKKVKKILPVIFLTILVIELLFVSNKYNSFSRKEYFYPSPKAISYLQSHLENYRVMSIDRRALPANISVWYKLQSVSGYDPLYLQRYGEYVSALERNRPDISQPFGFQRIITPEVFDSPLIDLLGVKYVVSLTDLTSPHLKKVFMDGEMRIYENMRVGERAFFVKDIITSSNKDESIRSLFKMSDLKSMAVVEGYSPSLPKAFSIGDVAVSSYSENSVTLSTTNDAIGFLVLTDIDYPIWHATIDGKKVPIYRTDYLFRGVVVPGGPHTVQFNNRLFSL